ncbi:MAG TPA: hypothetical protein VNL98_06690, partial [Gemmatimonadales bacterium]|nr:hypothetical protein [Gemmatimonadales bacterium]
MTRVSCPECLYEVGLVPADLDGDPPVIADHPSYESRHHARHEDDYEPCPMSGHPVPEGLEVTNPPDIRTSVEAIA